MAMPLIEILSEVFENVEQLNPEKLKKLSEETAQMLGALQAQMNSGDPQAVAEAKNTAMEIKGYVEGQIARLAEMSGIDYQELVAMAQNPQFQRDATAELQKLEQELRAKSASRRHINNNKTHLS